MIDMLGTEPQFVDHLAAVWNALPVEARGDFIAARFLRERAARRGVLAARDVHDDRNPILVASYGDIKRARRMGRTRIAFIEHGIGQSYSGAPGLDTHASYSGGRDRADIGLFLVPNENAANRWRETYPEAHVEIVGCPKLDALPAKEPGPLTVAVSFHFDLVTIPETRSTFPFYKPVLSALAQRFHLIGHGHPKAWPNLERAYRRMNIEPVEDFADVCRMADLYVCDNSSTLFEFASTGRPVVVLNRPPGLGLQDGHPYGYRRDINHGLRFWEAAGVGVNVWSPDDLIGAVELALEPAAMAEAREAALDIVYARRHGAPELAAVALMAWAGERQEVAA